MGNGNTNVNNAADDKGFDTWTGMLKLVEETTADVEKDLKAIAGLTREDGSGTSASGDTGSTTVQMAQFAAKAQMSQARRDMADAAKNIFIDQSMKKPKDQLRNG